MQSDNKEIYRLTAEREGVPFQLYKDLGGFVFNKLYATLKRPPKLIIKVRGLGNWFLRRQRIKRILQYFNENFENAEKIGNTIVLTENREELYRILTERDKDYDRYVTLKHEIRKIRYETQTLLEPNQGENDSTKAS